LLSADRLILEFAHCSGDGNIYYGLSHPISLSSPAGSTIVLRQVHGVSGNAPHTYDTGVSYIGDLRAYLSANNQANAKPFYFDRDYWEMEWGAQASVSTTLVTNNTLSSFGSSIILC
jgi:hypothetical protein